MTDDAYKASHALSTRTVAGANPASAAPLLQVRPDLRVLPLRDGIRSALPPKAAANLHLLSRKLHVYLNVVARLEPGNRDTALDRLRKALEQERSGQRPEWLRPEVVPTLTQMLMSEDARGRRLLVDLLAGLPGRQATETLAQRAVFDLDAGIREAAIETLRERRDEARPVLLAGLRHIWVPAADHAAEALVALHDRVAIPGLIDLLDQPDPTAPRKRGQMTVVSELVRLNHLTNCLVCHAPVLDQFGLIQGQVPGMTQVVPQKGYGGKGRAGKGSSSSGSSAQLRMAPVWIRADITFLRQDFSVQVPVLPVQGAPAVRFDYVVRTRELSPQESRQFGPVRGDPMAYPQREAVLFALRELTGQNHGPNTLAWRRHFPRARQDLQPGKKDINAGQKVQYLSDMNEFDLKVSENRFAKKGKLGYGEGDPRYGYGRIRVNGKESPNGLSLCPQRNTYAGVKYRLGKTARTFMASAALNDSAGAAGLPPGVGRIPTPLTFHVLGDGKLLWKSKPIDIPRKVQECKVDVTWVHVLELRIACPGSHVNAQAVWIEPHLLLK